VGPAEPVDPSLLGPDTPDYFVYWAFEPNHREVNDPSPWSTGSYGSDGWVGGDGIDRIIHYNNSLAYIYTVTIPAGADPHAHPNNPYAPGDIAPRTITLERIFDLGVTLDHDNEFYVDAANNELYLGAYWFGIRKYVFDPAAENLVEDGPAGNYVYDSTIAPPTPEEGGRYGLHWTQSLAYDPDNNTWYSGSMGYNEAPREVWKYEGAQGPDGEWELAFTYDEMVPEVDRTGYPESEHHDGMEFVNGYLYLIDMYSNYVLKITTDGILADVFWHAPFEHEVEALGFGALEHFWVGSHGGSISEFGGGLLQAGLEGAPPATPPIHVETGCVLVGWDPNDPNDFWSWDVNSWDSNTGNIDADPCFVAGYYLSHIDAGQSFDSPCINAGSDEANDANIGMHTYTTRMDGVNDVNIVDMGYHYSEGLIWHLLTVSVVDGNGTVDPNGEIKVYEGYSENPVSLMAGWYDANTLVSVLGVHDVVMDSNHTYTLRFRQPIKINVGQGPGHDHATIQAALADGSSGDDTIARSGDTIIVHEGTYQGDLNFGGREDVRLISTAPEDPDVAAKTIIDCQGSGRAFTFNHGEDTNTVVDGFTIINGGLNGEPGGAIYIDANSNPTLAHLIISNFSVSDADGGAIYIGPGSSPKLCAITINSCSVSSGDGGAIYADSNSSPTFKKLEISNCSASDGDGGAVYVGPDSTPTFIQCTITGCSASDGYGGAVYCGAGSSPELTDCEFSGNTAGHGGGGLYCSDDSTSTLDRCTLTNNEAGSGGGAYYALGCVSEVNECTFVGNRALLDAGGGIRYKGDSSITIVDCNISDNSAQHAGALCFDSNCSGAVTNSLMLGNDANMYGGAVYVTDCDLLVADCNISYNTALYGAGLYCVDSPLVTIANCDIKHNEAVGIKIYYEYYLPDPNDPNWPLDPNDPNAQVLPPIQVFPDDPNFNPNDPNLITLTIEDRTAIARGGGIYSWSGPSLIQDCEIIGNSAGTSGGGIYFAYGEYYLTTLKNCLLAYNSAIRDGGGVSSNWGNWLLISNCTIADNTVPGIGGGLYASYESNVEVVNSIIWRNIGAAGAQIAAGSGADCQSYAAAVDVTYSTVGPYFEPVDPNDPNQVGLISPIGFAPVLTVTTPVDAETLVENILGTGISASNISFTGDPNAAGTFVGGIAAGIGMEAGIILTSGHASTAPGADPCQPGVNSQDGATGNNGQPGDDDLAELIPGYSVHDAVVLEFDFVSEGGDLFFSYVFASEEYNEYANTSFNDVFGFFLDGKNIALIPGTQTPVSINNVNGGNPFGQDASYPELFNNNDPSDLEGDEPGYAFEYDGFLNVFTAEALNVGPGVHHIKLAIADAGDSILDSAVFFQYGSFSDVRPFYPPIFVEGDATLVGWQPDEPNNPWSWTPESWDANNFNLGEDPNFVHGYYLSHIDTDQEVNSPCIDAGTGLAKDVFTGAGTYTTRIDGANDIPDSNVDMGYHYGEGVALYELTITLTDANGTFTVDPDYFKSYDSNTNTYTYTNFVGHVSTLTALPDANYYVEAWYEPNGAAASISKVFDVVMDSNRAYTLEFKPRRTTLVTGGGPALRDAVEAAGHGDIIVVEKGYTYDGDIDLQGKEIAIVSILPVNPDLVETAIIDCGGSTRAFIFDSGEGPGTVIEGFTIINGSLSGTSGGAIYIGFGSSPTLADLIIRNCSVVNGSGGAIYVGSNSGASLNNIVIENCSASGNGGGVYISSNSNPTLKYCKIINCSASMGSGGGVYCGTASSPEFTGCTFSDNYARYSGGGLHCAHEGAVTLNECTFSRNTADSGGGAYCGINCVSDVNGCTFSGNSATEDYGGGILYGVGNVMTVNDCNFANNSAIFGGGLYCEPNCTGTITNSLLVGNDADEDGGAIYITDSNIVVSECDILSNTAPHGAGLYCLYSPESSIVGCNIRHNEALRVVVSYEYFYPDPNDANLPDLDNPVDTSDPNFDPNDPNYTSVQHRDDTGPAQGGGIFSFAGPQLIKDCQISYNTATTSGGAVYLAGDDDFESGVAVELKNCLITKNQAGRDGAGISCNWFIEAIISNCTIANNRLIGLLSYGGGLYCSFESDVLVTDSIIWGNSSVKGSQLAVGSGARSYEWPSTLTVEHSVVDTRIAEPSQPVNPDALPVIREGFDAYSLYLCR